MLAALCLPNRPPQEWHHICCSNTLGKPHGGLNKGASKDSRISQTSWSSRHGWDRD